MPRYVLTCLLCSHEEDGRAVLVPEGKSQLVAYQEHAMDTHDLSQEAITEALRATPPSEISMIYVWTLRDGRPWLRAEQLSGLIRAARIAGHMADEFASFLNIGLDVLGKLDARVIVGASIPSTLLRAIAQAATADLALVEAYLDAPPVDGLFRCGPGPQRPLGKEPFSAAIRSSAWLTDEQRNAWLQAVREEGKE